MESECPCGQEFHEKESHANSADVYIDTTGINKVCVVPVDDEIWYYYHVKERYKDI